MEQEKLHESLLIAKLLMPSTIKVYSFLLWMLGMHWQFESPYKCSLILKSNKFGFSYSHTYQLCDHEQLIELIRTPHPAFSNANHNQPLIVGVLRVHELIHANFLKPSHVFPFPHFTSQPKFISCLSAWWLERSRSSCGPTF